MSTTYLNFPFALTSDGAVATADEDRHIRQRLEQIDKVGLRAEEVGERALGRGDVARAEQVVLHGRSFRVRLRRDTTV